MSRFTEVVQDFNNRHSSVECKHGDGKSVPRDDFGHRACLASKRLYRRAILADLDGNGIQDEMYSAILWAFKEGEKVGAAARAEGLIP